MIIHSVYCKLPDNVDTNERAAVMTELAAMQDEIDGMLSFEAGSNRDYEGLSAGFSWGFVSRFTNPASLAAYAEHPAHKAAGGRLLALCEGGLAGLMVFDLEVSS